MKKSICFLLLSLPLFTLWFCTSSSTGREKENSDPGHSGVVKAGYKNVAVLELFTSQGCSSCPAADGLLGTYTAKENVIALSYHVDYWDRLGWKDAFSSADYSKRQNEYARWLNLSQVYTPQIIVNGKKEFVGSQEGALRNAIKSSLQESGDVQLNLNVTRNVNNTALVQYKVEENTGNSNNVISLVLVQKQAVIKVERGENGGRTLAHAQIVRNLQTQSLSKNTGSATLALPAGFSAQGWEVIGFVQNTSNGAVLGASKAQFKVTAAIDRRDTPSIQ